MADLRNIRPFDEAVERARKREGMSVSKLAGLGAGALVTGAGKAYDGTVNLASQGIEAAANTGQAFKQGYAQGRGFYPGALQRTVQQAQAQQPPTQPQSRIAQAASAPSGPPRRLGPRGSRGEVAHPPQPQTAPSQPQTAPSQPQIKRLQQSRLYHAVHNPNPQAPTRLQDFRTINPQANTTRYDTPQGSAEFQGQPIGLNDPTKGNFSGQRTDAEARQALVTNLGLKDASQLKRDAFGNISNVADAYNQVAEGLRNSRLRNRVGNNEFSRADQEAAAAALGLDQATAVKNRELGIAQQQADTATMKALGQPHTPSTYDQTLQRELAKDDVRLQRERREAQTGDAGVVSTLQEIDKLSGETGFWDNLLGATAEALPSGIQPKEVTQRQVYDALTNRLSLEFSSALKGQTSDKDIAFLKATVPKFGNTPEANRQITANIRSYLDTRRTELGLPPVFGDHQQPHQQNQPQTQPPSPPAPESTSTEQRYRQLRATGLPESQVIQELGGDPAQVFNALQAENRALFENNPAFLAREQELRQQGYSEDEMVSIMDREF